MNIFSKTFILKNKFPRPPSPALVDFLSITVLNNESFCHFRSDLFVPDNRIIITFFMVTLVSKIV